MILFSVEEVVEVEVVEDGGRVVAPDHDQKRGTEKKIRWYIFKIIDKLELLKNM